MITTRQFAKLAPPITNKTGVPCTSFGAVQAVLERFRTRRPPDRFVPALVALAGSDWAFLLPKGDWAMTLDVRERRRCRYPLRLLEEPWHHTYDLKTLALGAKALKLLTETEYFDFYSWLTAVSTTRQREADIRRAERELTQAGWTVKPPGKRRAQSTVAAARRTRLRKRVSR